MISTGNDIVALNAVKPGRALHPEYYSKILSASEEHYFNSLTGISISFETYVWLLWSVKESAYKYCKRHIQDLEFSPTRIVVTSLATIDNMFRGTVLINDVQLFFRSNVSEDWISSVVNSEDGFDEIFCDVHAIEGEEYAVQSAAVRAFALKKLSFLLGTELSIEKDPIGFPVVMRGKDRLPVPLSFSHHGKFVAYSFRVPQSLV